MGQGQGCTPMELTCTVTQRQTSTCPKRGPDSSARPQPLRLTENILDRFSSARVAALAALRASSLRRAADDISRTELSEGFWVLGSFSCWCEAGIAVEDGVHSCVYSIL